MEDIRVALALATGYGRFYDRIVDIFGSIDDILPRFRTSQPSVNVRVYLAHSSLDVRV